MYGFKHGGQAGHGLVENVPGGEAQGEEFFGDLVADRAGMDNDFEIRLDIEGLDNGLRSINAGQTHVHDGQVYRLSGKNFQPFLTAFSHEYAKPHILQVFGKAFSDAGFIINDKYFECM